MNIMAALKATGLVSLGIAVALATVLLPVKYAILMFGIPMLCLLWAIAYAMFNE